MPINMSEWRRSMGDMREAFAREEARWEALSPKQRAFEKELSDAQWKRARDHIAFLDYCVAKKIDPNLVLPVRPKS